MVMTLDAVIARNDDEDVSAWTSLEDQQSFHNLLKNYDAVVTGRASFFGKAADVPYYILTKTPSYTTDDKNIKYLNGDVDHIMDILAQDGVKHIALLGGPKTNHQFLERDLVDDIYITIEPILFGQGKHLTVPESLNTELLLVEYTRLNNSGTMLLHYHVKKNRVDLSFQTLNGSPPQYKDPSKLMAVNKDFWNERAPIHAQSDFYNIQSIIRGESSLFNYEIEEIGDIKGKRLIHLQCHIGTDTVSLARLGAITIGLDYSEASIEQAKMLAYHCGVECEFITANVYDTEDYLFEDVDIVYVNFGAITLLPNLNEWAKMIYSILKSGGYLYINETHPISNVLAMDSPRFADNYFDNFPKTYKEPGSYAMSIEDRYQAQTKHNELTVWDRTLGEIVSVIAANGFKIEFLHEHQGYPDQRFFYLKQSKEDGLWYPREGYSNTPAAFSLKATKID